MHRVEYCLTNSIDWSETNVFVDGARGVLGSHFGSVRNLL